MKITEKKSFMVDFRNLKPGEVFKSNERYMMKIEGIQSYDADGKEPFWVNAVSLQNGSFTEILDMESVELVKNCELVIH